MKFTRKQQKFIDEVQSTIAGPKPPEWLNTVLTPLPLLLLLSMVWGHWYNGPTILSDLAYGLIVFTTVVGIAMGSIALIILSKTEPFRADTDKVLFFRHAPIFMPKYKLVLSTIYYIGGFVVLAAMGHGWLAGFLFVAGLLSFLYNTTYIYDAKMRLETIDTASIA